MASTLIAPTPITIPFAASGSKNTIPTTSQIGVVDGAASYPDGFPPLCGTPLESGGKPPSRSDMNGILHGITENLRYLLGGCVPKFNAIFAAAIGGYPVGSIVQDNSGANCYRNLVDGNSIDFNTTPASIGVSWELVYGPGKTIPSASTSVQGKIEIATLNEAILGLDTARAVTPAGLTARIENGIDSIHTRYVHNGANPESFPLSFTYIDGGQQSGWIWCNHPTDITRQELLHSSNLHVRNADTVDGYHASSFKRVAAGYGGIGTGTLKIIDQDSYSYALDTIYSLDGLGGGWRCTGRGKVSYCIIYLFEREY